MGQDVGRAMSRRQLLSLIGLSAGGSFMYQAMHSLGFAGESPFAGPVKLGAAPAGASVLVLGAGLAGLVAAYELRRAGYRVQLLEYNARPGGRNWTLSGGDRFTELGGETQTCGFEKGLYLNPGPWRLPHHHRGMLHYCKELGIRLEPFIQVNQNAWVHSRSAFGGKPQRFRAVNGDARGHIAELLAKATHQHLLDGDVTTEDQQKLLEGLRFWGGLNADFRYLKGEESSGRRGFDRDPGGGLSGSPVWSDPTRLQDLTSPVFWGALVLFELYEMQSPMFQPVGGMGQVGLAFARALEGDIRYQCRVVDISQDDHGVSVAYEDQAAQGQKRVAQADWCVCTIPLSILGQIPMKVGAKMTEAIGAVPYASAVKIGLQFKRRFWEQDDYIFGGISFTDLPIGSISYPSSGLFGDGKGVLLGGYLYGGDAMEFTGLPATERVTKAIEYGRAIHPQYPAEFDNGISVAWHRVPGAMGCFGMWTEATRKRHYNNLCALDGRIVLAGEHASYLPAWQEGAVTSAIDAITRLHQKAVSAGGVA